MRPSGTWGVYLRRRLRGPPAPVTRASNKSPRPGGATARFYIRHSSFIIRLSYTPQLSLSWNHAPATVYRVLSFDVQDSPAYGNHLHSYVEIDRAIRRGGPRAAY
jgi:hypothetical protein